MTDANRIDSLTGLANLNTVPSHQASDDAPKAMMDATAQHQPTDAERPPEQSLDDWLGNLERQEILRALAQTRWHRTEAAKLLGISFRSLRYKLKKLALED